MSDALTLLDKALEKGQSELRLLEAGEVAELEPLAQDRSKLIEQAMKFRDPEKVNLIRDKLIELQTLQGQLTKEALRVREVLKEDLQRAKQENKRFTGYGRSVKPVSLGSRFISRIG